MSTVSEFFLLRAADQTAKRTPEDRRLEVLRELSLGRQRAEAADALWTNGHTAEGLRLAAEAFRATRLALDVLHPADEPDDEEESPLRAQLASAGMGEERRAKVVAAAEAIADAELPLLDDEVTKEQGALFRELVAARKRLDEVVAPASLTPRQVGWTRRLRVGAATAALLAVLLVLFLLFGPGRGIEATASATWGPQEGLAEFAVDGNPETEWQLPNRQTGWLEVTLSPPERIETLRLLNGHNDGYNDRAIRTAVVELYTEEGLAGRHEERWDAIVPRPEWREIEVGVDAVERIRVVVGGFHREGAALAEIEWR